MRSNLVFMKKIITCFKSLSSWNVYNNKYINGVLINTFFQNSTFQRSLIYKYFINSYIPNSFITALPFKLTVDQLKSIDEIKEDMSTKTKMNRLIIGDVGSGKTIICIIASYINILAGYQTAFMAPTEVLAIQHFNNINKLFKQYNISCELLIGSMKKK